ncbi:Rho termination factor N-terminal domain-containing protein, partial [Acinetobacter baumannii]|uniref:Rho termination factor N-terminal domain-containing protein n=1 Tax=Acinetobacter baumannii TaxID=470 RepID=UPI001D0DA8D7
MTASNKFLDSSSIIKMNNQTIKELRALAKERGLRGYYKLRKAELIDLLDSPVRPPRRPGQVDILPEDMDDFELQEMVKNRSVVKRKLNEWYDWLVSYVPEPIKNRVSKAYSSFKSTIMRLYGNQSELVEEE